MKKYFIIILFFISICSTSFAEEPTNPFKEGWYMDCVLRYDSFSGDLDYLKPSGSANLNLGYASNGRFAFEGGILLDSQHSFKSSYTYWLSDGYSTKYFDKFIFGGLVLNAKYYIGRPEKYFPFIKAGIGFYALMDGTDYGLTGTGYQIGGGIEKYVSRKIMLQFGLMQRIVKYDKAIFDGEIGSLNNAVNGNTLSTEFGISYRFWN